MMFSAIIATVPAGDGAAQAKSSSRCGSAAGRCSLLGPANGLRAPVLEPTKRLGRWSRRGGSVPISKRVRDCIHLQTASRWTNVLPRISASPRRAP
jgi:hypothetical protein